MFVRFDLKRRTSPTGSFSLLQTKWVPNGFSAFFSLDPNTTSNDYFVEAYTSFAINGCSFPFTTFPTTCQGSWSLFDDSEIFELGYPSLLVDVIDNEDGSTDGVFCEDDILVQNGGVSFQTFASNADRAYMVTICQSNSPNPAPGSCLNQKGTGWRSGKLPPTFNLLTELWRTSPNSTWRFWAGYYYHVTVAISSLPCSSWEARTFSFRVEGC